jgi:hypothetical protein
MEIKINNCMDCLSHQVFLDPDPNDWFCDDDVKVICSVNNRQITGACRPYNTRKECDIPTWCPKL